ncbi:MAG: hypothetical protein ACYC2P_04875 [Paludibacteraceae bacterium]
MYNKKLLFAVILLATVTHFAVSQNNTNSPYTRFGYGEISDATATELRGMGGVSLGNRSQNTINSVNPASYSSVDSLTFMFDLGVGMRYSRFSDLTTTKNTLNANLEYITMRFPLAKWLGFSAGLLPYSLVGYNFSQSDSITIPRNTPAEDPYKVGYQQTFSGTGGLSQLYGGLSVGLFNRISLGVNAYYIFGDVSNLRAETFSLSSASSSVYLNQIKASDFKFRYGLQLYNTFADKHEVTLGLIYENKKKLNGEFTSKLNGDTLKNVKGFELPQTLGVGLSYTFDKKLTIGMDYNLQKWGDALFFGKTDSLVNTSKIAFGAEYIPNPSGRVRYSDHIRYRIGFSTTNQYYKVGNSQQPNNLVVSVGVGLPTRTGKSIMNASLEYGKIGSTSMLREDYLKLTFSTSINEFWFFKPKL